jgi:hypothetical protein
MGLGLGFHGTWDLAHGSGTWGWNQELGALASANVIRPAAPSLFRYAEGPTPHAPRP